MFSPEEKSVFRDELKAMVDVSRRSISRQLLAIDDSTLVPIMVGSTLALIAAPNADVGVYASQMSTSSRRLVMHGIRLMAESPAMIAQTKEFGKGDLGKSLRDIHHHAVQFSKNLSLIH